jgi:hypothetical protein
MFLAVASAVPVLRGIPVFLAREVPGGGIFRDAQKFVAPYVLLLALAFGYGIDSLTGRLPALAARPASRGAMSALFVALPLALAPTLAWGAGGKLFTASYPVSWDKAERIMAVDPAPGGVLVLPWHAYLPFSWNRDRPVLQPSGQYFSRRAVVDGRLVVGPYLLPAEDPWARLATPVLEGPRPLAGRLGSLGIRYVLLLKEADWRQFRARLEGPPVLQGRDLALYRVSHRERIPTFKEVPAVPVIAADLVTLGFLSGAALVTIRGRRRSSTGA